MEWTVLIDAEVATHGHTKHQGHCSFLRDNHGGCDSLTLPAELLFTDHRVDRTVEVNGIVSEFEVEFWIGDASRVPAYCCLFVLSVT